MRTGAKIEMADFGSYDRSLLALRQLLYGVEYKDSYLLPNVTVQEGREKLIVALQRNIRSDRESSPAGYGLKAVDEFTVILLLELFQFDFFRRYESEYVDYPAFPVINLQNLPAGFLPNQPHCLDGRKEIWPVAIILVNLDDPCPGRLDHCGCLDMKHSITPFKIRE